MDTDRVFSDQPRGAVDVLFITMPFGPLNRPSLGLSLLQAGLHQASVSSKILYFTLLFAKHIGEATYEQLSVHTYAFTKQVGEWMFSAALFPGQDPMPYLETILFAENLHHQQDTIARRAQVEELGKHLLAIRAQVNDFIEECLAIVLRYRPKIVGFTSTFQQQLASLALAKRIKAHDPQTIILFGGANVEGIMGVELVRQFPFVDAVVSGEGDSVVPEMVTRLLDGRSICDLPNVYTTHTIDCISSNGTVGASAVSKLDSLPYPDYDDFFAQKQELCFDFAAHLPFETSRGCWWGAKQHCTFCGLNGLTMHFRSKSSERAIEELTYLTARYPGEIVAAVDNILDMTYFKTFLPALAKLGLELKLFYEMKANLKKEQLQLLRQANVQFIQPGIESFSTYVLHLMRKGVRALQNIQLLKWCEELGIVPAWNLIWGFPGEPPEEYTTMAQILSLISHLMPPRNNGQIRLDRFSPLFAGAENLGLAKVQPCPCYHYIYVGIPDHRLAKLVCYFTFEYADGRDVPGYTHDVVQVIKSWRDYFDQSFLYLVHQNEDIFIWDLRPIAPTILIRFTGLERDLYLACDMIQGLDSLMHIAERYVTYIDRDEMQALMQGFVDMKLMLREADTYLSLAVWLDKQSPCIVQYQKALAILERFEQIPEHSRMNSSTASTAVSIPEST